MYGDIAFPFKKIGFSLFNIIIAKQFCKIKALFCIIE